MPGKDIIKNNTEKALKDYKRFTGPEMTVSRGDTFTDTSFTDVKYEIPEGLDEKTCRLIVLGSLLEEAKAIKAPKEGTLSYGFESFGRTMVVQNFFSADGDQREQNYGGIVKNARVNAKNAIENFKNNPEKAIQYIENATKGMVEEMSSERPFRHLNELEVRIETICAECRDVIKKEPFKSNVKLTETEKDKLDIYSKAAPVSAEFMRSYVPTAEEIKADKDYYIRRELIAQNLPVYEEAVYSKRSSEITEQIERDMIHEFAKKYPDDFNELAPTPEEKAKVTWKEIMRIYQNSGAQAIDEKYQKVAIDKRSGGDREILPIEQMIKDTKNSERLSETLHSRISKTKVYQNTDDISKAVRFSKGDPKSVEISSAFGKKEPLAEKNTNDALYGYYNFTGPTVNLRENNFDNKDFVNVTYEIPEGLDRETCSMIVLGAMLEKDRLNSVSTSSTGANTVGQESMSRTFLLDNIFSDNGDRREQEYGDLINSGRIDAKEAIENFKKDPSKAMHYIENAARNLILENSEVSILTSFSEEKMRYAALCAKANSIISKEPFKSGVKLEQNELKRLDTFTKAAQIAAEYTNYKPTADEIKADKDFCLRKMIISKGLPSYLNRLNEERRVAETAKFEEAEKPGLTRKIIKDYEESAQEVLDSLKPAKKSLEELTWDDLYNSNELRSICQAQMAMAIGPKLAKMGDEPTPTEQLIEKVESMEEFSNLLYAKVAQTEVYRQNRDLSPEQFSDRIKGEDPLFGSITLKDDYAKDFNAVFMKDMNFKQYAIDQHTRPLTEMSEIFSGTEGLFHGRSPQYREMTERLKEFTELGRNLGDNPSHPDLLKYQAKMEGLLESVNAYVSYKEPQNDTGRTGTKRLETAKKLQEYLKREIPTFKKNLQTNDDMEVARQNAKLKEKAISVRAEKVAPYEKASGWRQGSMDRLFSVMGPHFNPNNEIREQQVFRTSDERKAVLGPDVTEDPLTDYELPEGCKYTEHEASIIALACFCRPDTAGSHDHIVGQSPEERVDGNFTFAVEAFVSSYRKNVGSTLHEGLDRARGMVPEIVEDTPALAEQLAKAIKIVGPNVCSRETLSPTVLGYAQISKELIGLIDRHPELKKEITERKLLTSEEMDNCRAYGNLADIMDNKAKAEEKLFKCSLGEVELSPDEVKECITSIALYDAVNAEHSKNRKEMEKSPEYQARANQTHEEMKAAMVKNAGDKKAIENAQFKAQSDMAEYIKALPPSKALTTLSKAYIEKESRKIREQIDSSVLSGRPGAKIWERYKKKELYTALATPKTSVNANSNQNVKDKAKAKSGEQLGPN